MKIHTSDTWKEVTVGDSGGRQPWGYYNEQVGGGEMGEKEKLWLKLTHNLAC